MGFCWHVKVVVRGFAVSMLSDGLSLAKGMLKNAKGSVAMIGAASSSAGKSQSPDSERRKRTSVTEPLEALHRDFREYQCYTWHLEPTVRLLSWAGKGIEPYGVDYILHKLGFSHARVTIPKWLQRGCMDPLDLFLSVLLESALKMLR